MMCAAVEEIMMVINWGNTGDGEAQRLLATPHDNAPDTGLWPTEHAQQQHVAMAAIRGHLQGQTLHTVNVVSRDKGEEVLQGESMGGYSDCNNKRGSKLCLNGDRASPQ